MGPRRDDADIEKRWQAGKESGDRHMAEQLTGRADSVSIGRYDLSFTV